jgi:uncharacterized repeat protein (TIGR03803 family)
MARLEQNRNGIGRLGLWTTIMALAISVWLIVAVTDVQAQAFSVLHDFTGGADGQYPFSGVTVGGPGVLYGTTSEGGMHDNGVVFKLAQGRLGWVLYPLYEFPGGSGGFNPLGPVTVGPNGALYGTTEFGGSGSGTGTVFELRPPATGCKAFICYWSETVLHSFNGNDGAFPFYGALIFDQAGNIYGATEVGGAHDDGTVFELTPSGGGWTESVLHSFNDNGIDGYEPWYGVIFDPAGNLYGTTSLGGTSGGSGGGTVFELSPSGGTWTESILYDFPQEGSVDPSALIMDQSGNLYGATYNGGTEFNGTVFELTPSEGSWVFSTLYTFDNTCSPGSVTMDTAGNLYGACLLGGRYDSGSVFKLTNSGGSWTLTNLHTFTGGSDGAFPYGAVALDASGNLYGTTDGGGTYGDGVVWEVTP